MYIPDSRSANSIAPFGFRRTIVRRQIKLFFHTVQRRTVDHFRLVGGNYDIWIMDYIEIFQKHLPLFISVVSKRKDHGDSNFSLWEFQKI